MAAQNGEDAYVTLLLSDTYLPGALVLAHSLRDAGTTKKLAVLVTLDSVSAEVITQLKSVFDHVIPVPRVRNEKPANLYLMNRADLHSAFTKINLWKQTQFRRIVYVDADVVAYRAPDELFDLDHPFSAAPDIGWPDLFNTGVMALTPNMGDYYALAAMAERGISFDGADQGLLNMHFKNNYNRLSFTYNVTPSGHYQYVPAYRHFQSSINMVHFIGSDKPWALGREASSGGSPYDEMLGRWWAVYDRHYRQPSPPLTPTDASQGHQKVPEIIQYFVKGEFRPKSTTYVVPTGQPPLHQARHEEREHKPEPRPIEYSWDAQRQAPPAGSKPEAMNFPQMHYEMSSDPAPFVPPPRYPSPPKNMWYEVPKEKPASRAEKPRPIFPWEIEQPRASRIFADDVYPSEPSLTEGSTVAPSGRRRSSLEYQTTMTEPSMTESSTADHKSEPSSPATPTIRITHSDPWASFTRVNAWDDDPAIDKYVGSMPLYRRHKSSSSLVGQTSPRAVGGSGVGSQQETSAGAEWRRRGSKLTDFPTAVERPSLPVTPAPIRRPKFWGAGGPGLDDEGEDDGKLPAADGVPQQSEWDPVARLQLLAKQQSELLLQKLGAGEVSGGGDAGGATGGEHNIPNRPLPFGSEDIVSPRYIARSSNVLSPQPVKPPVAGPQGILGQAQGESESTPRSTSATATETAKPAEPGSSIPEPSFHGPGPAWEKDEGYLAHSTAMPPSEEEKDVLQT
ncbi:glycogenin glucosyltransferase [Diaporthe eres]|uniref:Glycogenin glucosyltransferase n=1 Tax=Diaporthe eres TaxID=83184 RepID=A0ABR1NXR5_DIAER